MVTVTWRLLVLALASVFCLGCSGSPQPGKDVRQAATLTSEWQPPTEAMTDNMFPADVAGYKPTSKDSNAALLEFAFDRPGKHATYATGNQQIEVYVYEQITLADQDALRKGMKADQEIPGPEPAGLSYGEHWLYSSTRGQRYWVFPKGNWVVIFRAAKAVDQLPFAEGFLHSLSPRKP